MATFHHEHDHGVVSFSGDLSWDESRALVDAVDTLVDSYFYDEVELVISSPGGQLAALDHFLDAAQRWRARGVRLRTYVADSAQSAAALMLALGDLRVAEPHARLLFHAVGYVVQGPVTASRSVELQHDLNGLDARNITHLMQRVMRDGSSPAPPAEAELSDRLVLERLVGRDVASPRNGVRRVRALARALGRRLSSALRAGSPLPLAKIYQQLFDLDTAISPRLARTLRLIDHVGRPEPSRSCAVAAPELIIVEWRRLFPPGGGVARELLLRNLLALGETGSGKTLSFVLPLLFALLRSPRALFGGAFVVDPKRELAPLLERAAPGRVRLVQPQDLVLNVMAGATPALHSDLAAGRWRSAATRIVLRLISFVPASPAHVLLPHPVTNSNSEFFNREGTDLLIAVLAVVLMATDPDAPPPEDWLDGDPEALDWLQALLARARGEDGQPGPNIVALTSWALGSPLLQSPSDDLAEVKERFLLARLARCASSSSAWPSAQARDVLDRVLHYWTPMAAIDRQYAGVLATARAACDEFSDPSVSGRLYFGFEPGYSAARSSVEAPDFPRLVSRDGDGSLVLFQPPRGFVGALVAMSLKSLFFEAVLTDPDRLAGRPDMPLVAYVADEFHRYATSDPLHGEQGFLDTCRSFGAFCALACQSVASVEHALACGAGNGAQDRAAVEILWTNCASKFFFRSTDPKTVSRVDDLSPYRPGLAGVTRVRPPSTLAPGECYVSLADSRFERRQLSPFVEPAPERAPSPPSRRRRARGAA